MENKIATLVGAMGALACASAVQATPAAAAPALAVPQSYADLLQPIANAKDVLAQADLQAASSEGFDPANVQLVQYHHHHHHHHMRMIVRRRVMMHHHHHHHHHHHFHRRDYY